MKNSGGSNCGDREKCLYKALMIRAAAKLGGGQRHSSAFCLLELLVEQPPPLHPASKLLGEGNLGQQWMRREYSWSKLSGFSILLSIISSLFLSCDHYRDFWFQSHSDKVCKAQQWSAAVVPQRTSLQQQETQNEPELFLELAELCCQKQQACESPGGINVSETVAFSIFLIKKNI